MTVMIHAILLALVCQATPDASYRPKVGDRASLFRVDKANPGSLLDVTMFRDGDAYLAYSRAVEGRDTGAVTRMVNEGTALRFKARTEVAVAKIESFPPGDPRPTAALVHVLTDPKPERVYWVPAFYVGRLKGEPAPPPPPLDRADEARIREGAARQMADSYLNIARNLEKSGKTDQAVAWYRKVVKEFPKAPEAKLARERLAALTAR